MKVGRSLLDKTDKTVFVGVKIPLKLKNKLKRKAKKEKYKTLSEYIRKALEKNIGR